MMKFKILFLYASFYAITAEALNCYIDWEQKQVIDGSSKNLITTKNGGSLVESLEITDDLADRVINNRDAVKKYFRNTKNKDEARNKPETANSFLLLHVLLDYANKTDNAPILNYDFNKALDMAVQALYDDPQPKNIKERRNDVDFYFNSNKWNARRYVDEKRIFHDSYSTLEGTIEMAKGLGITCPVDINEFRQVGNQTLYNKILKLQSITDNLQKEILKAMNDREAKLKKQEQTVLQSTSTTNLAETPIKQLTPAVPTTVSTIPTVIVGSSVPPPPPPPSVNPPAHPSNNGKGTPEPKPIEAKKPIAQKTGANSGKQQTSTGMDDIANQAIGMIGKLKPTKAEKPTGQNPNQQGQQNPNQVDQQTATPKTGKKVINQPKVKEERGNSDLKGKQTLNMNNPTAPQSKGTFGVTLKSSKNPEQADPVKESSQNEGNAELQLALAKQRQKADNTHQPTAVQNNVEKAANPPEEKEKKEDNEKQIASQDPQALTEEEQKKLAEKEQAIQKKSMNNVLANIAKGIFKLKKVEPKETEEIKEITDPNGGKNITAQQFAETMEKMEGGKKASPGAGGQNNNSDDVEAAAWDDSAWRASHGITFQSNPTNPAANQVEEKEEKEDNKEQIVNQKSTEQNQGNGDESIQLNIQMHNDDYTKNYLKNRRKNMGLDNNDSSDDDDDWFEEGDDPTPAAGQDAGEKATNPVEKKEVKEDDEKQIADQNPNQQVQQNPKQTGQQPVIQNTGEKVANPPEEKEEKENSDKKRPAAQDLHPITDAELEEFAKDNQDLQIRLANDPLVPKNKVYRKQKIKTYIMENINDFQGVQMTADGQLVCENSKPIAPLNNKTNGERPVGTPPANGGVK